jgi:hypothetical protein
LSSPAVAAGLVYAGSVDNKVYALNATTGTPIWNYTTGGTVVSPAVAGGVVFVGSADYRVYALNTTTGALIWNYTTGSWVNSSPAVAGGVVFVGSADGTVYAFGSPILTLTTDATNVQVGDLINLTCTSSQPTNAGIVINVTTPSSSFLIGPYSMTTGVVKTYVLTLDLPGMWSFKAYWWPLGATPNPESNVVAVTLTPTPTPTPSPTPTPTPVPTSIPTPTSTPAIPEFPSTAILLMLAGFIAVTVIITKKKLAGRIHN